MKWMQKSLVFGFLMAFMWSSGGATIYTHYCSMQQEKTIHLSKFSNHQSHDGCEMEKQSCCEKQQSEESDCCIDSTVFDTIDQVQPSDKEFSLETGLHFASHEMFDVVSLPTRHKLVERIHRPPPLVASTSFIILFQRFLC